MCLFSSCFCPSVEAFQSGNEDAIMESAEAAEALMNIDPSTPLALDDKHLRKCLHCKDALVHSLFVLKLNARLQV